MNEIDAEIGARVNDGMFRARLTQKQLGDALQLDQAAVSRRLRGATSWKASELVKLAELFGGSVADLIPEPAALAARHPRELRPASGLVKEVGVAEIRCTQPPRQRSGLAARLRTMADHAALAAAS
jgi:transcriptional regulator with XRE-family HTH domain